MQTAKISNAWISQKLKQNCNVKTDDIKHTMAIQYNDMVTNDRDIFDFDDKTGILTVKKLGNYTLNFNSLIQNIGSQQALFGISASRNGILIVGSQCFNIVKPNEIINLTKSISFHAKDNDVIIIVAEFTASKFKVPNSPAQSGFNSNSFITSGDWSPNSYTITYNGDIGCDCEID